MNVEIAFIYPSNYLFDHFHLFLIVLVAHIFLIDLYLSLLNTPKLKIDPMFNIMYLIANLLHKTSPIGNEFINLLLFDVIVSIYGFFHEFVVDDVDI